MLIPGMELKNTRRLRQAASSTAQITAGAARGNGDAKERSRETRRPRGVAGKRMGGGRKGKGGGKRGGRVKGRAKGKAIGDGQGKGKGGRTYK